MDASKIMTCALVVVSVTVPLTIVMLVLMRLVNKQRTRQALAMQGIEDAMCRKI